MVEMVEGARYRRRDGYEPPDTAERTGDDDYPWRVGWIAYTSAGNWSHGNSDQPEDLVAMTFDPRMKSAEPEAKTLRDEFAMAALQGLLACPDPGPLAENAAQFQEYVARLSYECADAMLKARAQ